MVKYSKTSFFWIFLCRNSSLTKTTDSYSFLLRKYLIFVNLCHITSSLNHSIMYAPVGAKKRASQKRKLLLSMKTLYSSPRHLTPENLVSPSAFRLPVFCFFSLSLFGLLRPLLQICRVWLTQTHQKTLNQVTLSNKHMNYLFWAWGNLVHYRINPQQVFIFRCVYFIDQKKDADRSATVACAVWHSQE